MSIVSIDLFAGGGGASEGIRRATGKAPVIAVNHDEAAILMHAANHPGTMHLCESVFDVAPVAPGGQLDLLWASPDCTHFSRAKGGKPVKKEIRALAWVVTKWARWARPRVICLENVPEFRQWGPLDPVTHKPIKARRGEEFKRFVQELQDCGYDVEWRVLTASEYGAPTSRQRLFMICRSDGQAIRWPEVTHGPDALLPYRTAAECIDWDIPCPSIFLDKASARKLKVKRPLADKTLARISEGMRRYVIEAEKPFLLNLTHGGRLEPLDEPFRTITGANRGEKALVTPYLATIDHQSSTDGSCVSSPTDPISTVTTKNRHVLLTPMLIQTRNGERPGQTPRTLDIRNPLNTITATGSQGALVTALLQSTHSNPVYRSPLDPLATVTASAGGHQSLVSAFLVKYYGQGIGQDLNEPLHTITNRARFGLVHAFLTKFYGTSTGSSLNDPMPTVTSGGKKGGGHLGLVTVWVNGTEYAIADIGLRMLQPRELARAQGFGDEYILTGNKSEQIARIGNSVPPPVVEAIVRAQFNADPSEICIQEVA